MPLCHALLLNFIKFYYNIHSFPYCFINLYIVLLILIWSRKKRGITNHHIVGLELMTMMGPCSQLYCFCAVGTGSRIALGITGVTLF